MRFTEGAIEGLWLIELEPVADHRGFFARTWCEDQFAEHGLTAEWPQQNLQFSPEPGTMRGLHYQIPPHSEIKLVRCTRGEVFDVAVDLRPWSSSYRKWVGNVLDPQSHKAVWVPRGCAHGYVTLAPNSEVFYLTSNRYEPNAVRGVRYNDSAFGISWPRQIDLVPSGYDTWPNFDDDKGRELMPLSSKGAE